jgi:hypothetical protein
MLDDQPLTFKRYGHLMFIVINSRIGLLALIALSVSIFSMKTANAGLKALDQQLASVKPQQASVRQASKAN